MVFSSLTVLESYPVISIDERGASDPDRLFAVLKDDAELSDRFAGPAMDLLTEYSDAKDFDRLDPFDCINEYAVSFLASRGGVFLVHELEEGDDFLRGRDALLRLGTARFGNPDIVPFEETFGWVCAGLERKSSERCRPFIDDIRSNASSWQPAIDRPVKYCLSRPMENQRCRVNFNIPLAIGVLASNLVKMAILGYVTLYLAPDRLLVLGDAIQSFLARPDPSSSNSCLASIQLVKSSFSSKRTPWRGARALLQVTRRWITPVGKKRVRAGVFL